MDPHQSSGQSPIIMFMRGLRTEVGLVASKNRPVEQTQVWVAADVIEPLLDQAVKLWSKTWTDSD